MPTQLPWHQIDTVLLDMDGTLIDLHFDNHLWQQLVPTRYAERLDLPLDQARAQIDAHYHAVSGTLDWYCVDYWSQTLGLDIRALKQEILEKIQWRPNVIPFLAELRAAGKQLVLFTNAHPASLSVKDARLGLAGHLDLMVSTHELGWSKESQHCWQALAERLAFDPAAPCLWMTASGSCAPPPTTASAISLPSRIRTVASPSSTSPPSRRSVTMPNCCR